jgi:hypothetical protein
LGDQATRPPRTPADSGSATVLLKVALASLGIAVLASWLFLAVVHVDDRFNVGWVEGSKMALAQSAEAGVLYPPLYDGDRYGGTRFMPIPILLHAGAAQLTSEYLISGKLVAYGSAGLLLGLTFMVLIRMPVPVPVALALTAGVLATHPGLLAATTVQGDGLSVFFQLAAVAVLASSKQRPATLAAAALCTLAISSKLSAVWAPLAISIWLLARDRRRLLLFLAALVLILLGMFAIFQLVTDGRLLANLTELSFAGVEGVSDVLRSPLRLLDLVIDAAPVLLVLAPFALFAEPIIGGRSEVSIYYLALLAAILTLLVVLSDRGALDNHLLDITVLTLIVVGRVWSLTARREPSPRLLPPILAFAVLWGVAVSAVVEMRVDLQQTVASLIRGERTSTSDHESLARLIGPQQTLLAEDPSVPLALGRTPVVLDAWALLRMARTHPDWVGDLVSKIEHQAFDKVVLVYPLSFQAWYRDIHFGQGIAEAIQTSYRFAGNHAGYYVYVPDRQEEPAEPDSATP